MFMLVRLYGPILRELQTNFEALKNQSLNLLARDAQSPLLLDVLFQIEIKYWYTLMRVRNRKILNPDSPQCFIFQNEEFVHEIIPNERSYPK